MMGTIPNSEHFIRDYFTKDRFDRQHGYSIRSVKKGNTFEAQISFPPEAREEVRKALQSVTRIGISEGGISGEVMVKLVEREVGQNESALSDLCSYNSLHYQVMLLTSACFYEPYGGRSSTSPYIPGTAVRQALQRSGLACAPDIQCSNAYISDGKKRLMPTPMCASLVKLDKTQLRYRMAAGKDLERAEQVVKRCFNIRCHCRD